MKIFKTLAIAVMGMVCATGYAQDTVECSVGADVVSRYVWRGQVLGDAAIQPNASLSYKGVSLSAWGSYGFLNTMDTKEFDLTLSYSADGFNIGVTDYWFSYYGANNKYFEYRAHETAHVWEGNIGYDFGPVALQWYTNFAGADGVNKDGKRAYSSYVTVGAPFSLATCDWQATVGIVPYATSSYADATGFAVTNLSLRATKEIALCKKYSLPIFMEGICNPSTKKGYLVVGTSFALPK